MFWAKRLSGSSGQTGVAFCFFSRSKNLGLKKLFQYFSIWFNCQQIVTPEGRVIGTLRKENGDGDEDEH